MRAKNQPPNSQRHKCFFNFFNINEHKNVSTFKNLRFIVIIIIINCRLSKDRFKPCAWIHCWRIYFKHVVATKSNSCNIFALGLTCLNYKHFKVTYCNG